ncbi:hypothetical protein IZU89_08895 [Cellulophaga lytica]|uniref:hypothetical protein n=1 Tax=Cellulophaga lytica TaxID=979 RepID=UPI0032E4F9EE
MNLNISLKLLIIFSLISNVISSQDYTIEETIDYINKHIESDYTLKLESNNLVTYWRNSENETFKHDYVEISKIGKVDFESAYGSVIVKLWCTDEIECAKSVTRSGQFANWEYLSLWTTDSQKAKLVSNAVRYLLANFKESEFASTNDPFDAYSSDEKIKEKDLDWWSHLKLGMGKKEVFQTIKKYDVDISIETLEDNSEIYRAYKYPNLLFLYFKNDKLIRADSGERTPDAIIKLEHN